MGDGTSSGSCEFNDEPAGDGVSAGPEATVYIQNKASQRGQLFNRAPDLPFFFFRVFRGCQVLTLSTN